MPNVVHGCFVDFFFLGGGMEAGREEGKGPIKLWWQKMKEKNHDNESNKVISKHFTFFVWKVAHMDMKSKCKAKSTYFTQKCNRTTTKHTFSPWLFSLLFSSFPLSCFSNKTTTNKHKKKKKKKEKKKEACFGWSPLPIQHFWTTCVCVHLCLS